MAASLASFSLASWSPIFEEEYLAFDLVRIHAASAGWKWEDAVSKGSEEEEGQKEEEGRKKKELTPPLEFGHESGDGIAFGEMLILEVALRDRGEHRIHVANVSEDGCASPRAPALAAHAGIVVVGEPGGATA